MFMYQKILALSRPTVLTEFFFFFCLNVGRVLMNIDFRSSFLNLVFLRSTISIVSPTVFRVSLSFYVPIRASVISVPKELNHIRYPLGLLPVCGLTVHNNLIRYNISRNFALFFLSG